MQLCGSEGRKVCEWHEGEGKMKSSSHMSVRNCLSTHTTRNDVMCLSYHIIFIKYIRMCVVTGKKVQVDIRRNERQKEIILQVVIK